MLDPVIPLLAALCGALLFGWTAIHKLRKRRDFGATLAEFQLLPGLLVPVMGVALAFLEVGVCVALLWPAARPAGAAAGIALLLLYALAMAINLARGRRDLDCGCGLTRRTISGGLVVRNVALAALLVLPAMQTSSRAMTLADYATIVGGLIVCALLYASAELLLARPVSRGFTAMEPS